MDSDYFSNMVKDPTCFKSSNPDCIDLILNNGKEVLKGQQQQRYGCLIFMA